MDITLDPHSFGALLRQHRMAASLSQELLAARARLSVNAIAALERGRSTAPRAGTLLLLADALGLTSAERAALIAAAAHARTNGRSDLSAAETPSSGARTSRPPSADLPLPLTSFVGRQREVAEVARLLETTRLLTLTGAGGVGKTRLALHVARKILETSPDGVRVALVELASVVDGELVPHAVTTALGIAEQPGRRHLDVLADAMRAWHLLLVLDNCEQVVSACAELAAHLLHACPSLTILATSREPLGLTGETAWRVPSLSLPTAADDLDAVAQAEAVRLFTQRAASVLPGFSLTDRNAGQVAKLCRRLDGIPLALELAAARVSALAVEQIAERLDDALGLLSARRRAAPAHQQTLRATLDWSYGLLAKDEQHLFDRLAVFAGGWTLGVAEAVCADAQIDHTAILDLLARLVDKSLVVCQHDRPDAVRYRLHETLLQYGQQRLVDRGEADHMRDRHAEYYLTLAERTEPALRGRQGLAARALLEEESDNLRAALRRLVDRGDVERAQRLAGALRRFWVFSGYLDEASTAFARVLAMPGADLPTAGRAQCLDGVSMIALSRGDLDVMEQTGREVLMLCLRLGDRAQASLALASLGGVARSRGDYAKARALFQDGLAMSRDAGHVVAEARCLGNLARLAYDLGDFAEAERWAQAGQARATEVGFGLARNVSRRILGLLAMQRGETGAARGLLESSLADSEDLGGPWWAAQALVSLAEFEIGEGNLDAARERIAEALRMTHMLADRREIAHALEVCARLAVAQRDHAAGLRLVGAASAMRRTHALELPPVERDALARCVAEARRAPDVSVAEQAIADGEALDLEEALSCALRVAQPRRATVVHRDSAGLLTNREQEVAELVARGLSNPQIAQELIVGERTAQTHVANILNKLGLSSRAQIAAWVAERRAVAARPN